MKEFASIKDLKDYLQDIMDECDSPEEFSEELHNLSNKVIVNGELYDNIDLDQLF